MSSNKIEQRVDFFYKLTSNLYFWQEFLILHWEETEIAWKDVFCSLFYIWDFWQLQIHKIGSMRLREWISGHNIVCFSKVLHFFALFQAIITVMNCFCRILFSFNPRFCFQVLMIIKIRILGKLKECIRFNFLLKQIRRDKSPENSSFWFFNNQNSGTFNTSKERVAQQNKRLFKWCWCCFGFWCRFCQFNG